MTHALVQISCHAISFAIGWAIGDLIVRGILFWTFAVFFVVGHIIGSLTK